MTDKNSSLPQSPKKMGKVKSFLGKLKPKKMSFRRKNQPDNTGFEDNPELPYYLQEDDGLPVYIVKQKYGYLAIFISCVQVLILITMLIQCNVAPLNINPMVGPYPDALSYWGGKNAYKILFENEWWRMISPILLHSGIIHLLCNIGVTLGPGAFFEREWGSFVWLTIYLVSAVGSNALSTIVFPNNITVGSSGAICGLFGGKIAEAFCRCCESRKSEEAIIRHNVLKGTFGQTLCSVILILLMSFVPYVDWAAHIGGLVTGFAIGMVIFSCHIKTAAWKALWFIVGFSLLAVLFTLSFVYMNRYVKWVVADDLADVCGYYMNIYDNYQCNCMINAHENNDYYGDDNKDNYYDNYNNEN